MNSDSLKKNGVLLKQIILANNDLNRKQKLLINNYDFTIDKLENILKIYGKGDYINTYSFFDNVGNFYSDSSYYFETKMIYENDAVYLICHFLPSHYDEKFILVGDYDEVFKLKSVNSLLDTFWFDKNNLAKITINQWVYGDNTKRFVIVDQTKFGGTKKQKLIYVDKEFFIGKESN